jgi:hypothetical protein
MAAQDGSVENLTRGNDDSARKTSFHINYLSSTPL